MGYVAMHYRVAEKRPKAVPDLSPCAKFRLSRSLKLPFM